MAMDKNDLGKWADRMEDGERDDELLAVAAELERAGLNEPSAMPLEFRRQLRRDLLNQFEASAESPVRRLWRLAASTLAVGLLGALVFALWMSMSSAGRDTPGVPAVVVDATATPLPSGYVFLDYSLGGGLISGALESKPGEQASPALLPGRAAEIITHWSPPAKAGPIPLFSIHLLDDQGNTVAQADAPLEAMAHVAGQMAEAIVMLDIPAGLAPGVYTMDGGLFDKATGARLTFDTPEGEVSLFRAEFVVAENSAEENDQLKVVDVQPVVGTLLTGTEPLQFNITVEHALSSLPQAILEVRVMAFTGKIVRGSGSYDGSDYTILWTEIENNGGRSVGLTTVDLDQGVSRSTIEVEVNTEELLGLTNLGLWLQIKPDASSPPLLIEMPDEYHWRYEP